MKKDLLLLLQEAKNEEEREWIIMQLSLNNLTPEIQEAVWAASILGWFDKDYLKAVLNKPSLNFFNDLIGLSYVERFENKGYNIHERSRKLLEKRLWEDKLHYYRGLSLRASDYCFTQNLEETNWMIEYICHLLIVKPEQGAYKFYNICVKWWNPPCFDYEKIEALIKSVQERSHATLNSAVAKSQCFYWEAGIKRMQSQYESAKSLYEQALQIYREVGDKLGEANTLISLGDIKLMQSQYKSAKSLHEQALPIYREVGDKLGEANTLKFLGNVEQMQSQYESAKSLYEQALQIYREVGDKLGEANTLISLGDVEQMQSQFKFAKRLYEQALQIYREVGSILGEANTLRSEGDVERMTKMFGAAKKMYSIAQDIYITMKEKFGESDCIFVFGELDRAQGKWQEAIDKYKKALAFYKEKNLLYEQAFVLWQLGMAYYGAKNQKLALDYLRDARCIFTDINSPKADRVQEVIEAIIKGTPFDAKTQFE